MNTRCFPFTPVCSILSPRKGNWKRHSNGLIKHIQCSLYHTGRCSCWCMTSWAASRGMRSEWPALPALSPLPLETHMQQPQGASSDHSNKQSSGSPLRTLGQRLTTRLHHHPQGRGQSENDGDESTDSGLGASLLLGPRKWPAVTGLCSERARPSRWLAVCSESSVTSLPCEAFSTDPANSPAHCCLLLH